MRIQRLEIQGFKSFADSTKIKFGEGITGVVGPNGCGKSNVVDALRWVMGEQSAKHLRGASMQDVIFNGSTKRGPEGMAQVSVTFTNDGKNIPKEYAHLDEIEVTRRLFRDGSSDYEINKSGVRLKDVHDLFLGTGIGKRGFSIIQQGQVGQIVQAKPSQRREIIEEAAGISKYKARKQAAERKMARTEQNLLRINDVLSEVGKRVGSLKRQADKARIYQELSGQVREIELRRSAHQLMSLRESIEKLGQESRQHENERDAQETKLFSEESEIDAMKAKLIVQDDALNLLQATKYELDQDVALREQSIQHAKELIKDLERTRISNNNEMLELQKALELLANQQEALGDDRHRLKDQLLEQQEALKAKETEFQEMIKLLKTCEHDLAACRLEVMNARDDRARGSTQIESSKRRIQDLSGSHEDLKRQEDDLKTTMVSSEKVLAEIESSFNEASSQLETLRASQETAKAEVEKARANVNTLKDECALTSSRMTEVRSKLSSLNELHDQYESAPDAVKAISEHPEIGKYLSSTLADHIQSKPEWEGATAAALGTLLHMVLVENQDAIHQVGEFLTQDGNGRVHLYCGSSEGDREGPSLSSEESARCDFATPMLSVVQFDAQVAGLRAEFEKTYFVRDTDSIFEHHDKAAALGLTLVHADGTIVKPSGVVQVGSQGSNVARLSYKRRVADLQEELAEVEREHSSKNNALESAKRALTEKSNTQQSAHDKVREAEKKKNHNQQALSKQRQEVAVYSSKLESITRRIETSKQELETIRKKLEMLEERYAKADTVIAEHEAKENAKKQALESARDSSEEMQRVITQQRIATATLAERQERYQRDWEHHNENRDQFSERVQTLQSASEGLDERESSAHTEMALHAEKLSNSKAELEIADKKLIKERQIYTQSRDAIQVREAALSTLRKSLDAIREEFGVKALKLKEAEVSFEHISQTLLRDYEMQPQDVIESHGESEALSEEELKSAIQLRKKLDRLGPININAIEEHAELSERHAFLQQQSDDLTHALAQLEKAIVKIDRTTKKRFKEAFEQINDGFQKVFPRLFRGGKASLSLTDPNDLLATGVEIFAQPPGKKLQSVKLMSGGEQALTAVSLIFAIFLMKPSPFCLLDEVDAPLDEGNVGRFNELIRDVSKVSQFIVITHNKKTMENTDILYGITMQEPGVSKAVNVKVS